MRKMPVVLTVLLMVPLFGLLTPAYATKPNETLKSELFIELNWDWEGFPWGTPGSLYTWIGTVWGDINGDFYVTLTEARYPGKTEHFSEAWIIVTTDGVIEGFDKGVWGFKTFKWVANGKVTDATGTWSHLVGWDMHYGGTTTTFPAPYGTPVNGTGTLILSSK